MLIVAEHKLAELLCSSSFKLALRSDHALNAHLIKEVSAHLHRSIDRFASSQVLIENLQAFVWTAIPLISPICDH